MLNEIISTKRCYEFLSASETKMMAEYLKQPTVNLLKLLCIESCEPRILAVSAAIYAKGHDMLIDRYHYLYQYNGVNHSMQNQ